MWETKICHPQMCLFAWGLFWAESNQGPQTQEDPAARHPPRGPMTFQEGKVNPWGLSDTVTSSTGLKTDSSAEKSLTMEAHLLLPEIELSLNI